MKKKMKEEINLSKDEINYEELIKNVQFFINLF